ncbi:MAG: exported protein of unknown function [Nitrospira sp.]|jgi:hypothetical protein|nr:exported protein of unknown function [Nitrospira sp.]
MRYSFYFAWIVAVLSICILTTLASFPGLLNGERPHETNIVAGAEGFRTIKIQRVRCNSIKSHCHLSRQKFPHKIPS